MRTAGLKRARPAEASQFATSPRRLSVAPMRSIPSTQKGSEPLPRLRRLQPADLADRDGEVGHGRAGGGAMPVLLAGRGRDRGAGTERLHVLAPRLNASLPLDEVPHLTSAVRLPGSAP